MLTAVGSLGGAALWCVRFVQRQRRQDKEIAAIRRGSVYLMTMTELADIDKKTAEEHQKDLGDILEFFRWR